MTMSNIQLGNMPPGTSLSPRRWLCWLQSICVALMRHLAPVIWSSSRTIMERCAVPRRIAFRWTYAAASGERSESAYSARQCPVQHCGGTQGPIIRWGAVCTGCLVINRTVHKYVEYKENPMFRYPLCSQIWTPLLAGDVRVRPILHLRQLLRT